MVERMITGRQTLASIDQALSETHSKIHAVEAQIDSVNKTLVDQQQSRTDDFRELARVRLDLLSDGELVRHLDQADQQVVALLDQRGEALQGLLGQIQDSDAAHQALETERDAQSLQVDAAAETVDTAEAQTQERLEADSAYRTLREQAELAERQAMHAQEKAARSEQEREQKGESYRNDPLFMYLWEHHYGLPEYQAKGLIRWLDSRVAKLIGFADARANYDRLNVIPARLGEHAERLKAAAEKEFQALQQADTEALESDGVPALKQRLAEEQTRLDAIDQRIEQAEAEQQTLLQRKAAFATGDDEYSHKAVQFLAAEFQRDDLMELRHAALNTPFPEDDLIVSRLLQREDEHRQIEASMEGLRETIAQHHKRLSELETLRVEFKRQRYDRSGSTFANGSLIAMMLGQFLNGMLDRKMLWKVLQEQQRYQSHRSNPTFGSGGFGRGTVWGGGLGDLPDLGDLIGRMGRGGGGFGRRGGGSGRGGGGFRTGGGF